MQPRAPVVARAAPPGAGRRAPPAAPDALSASTHPTLADPLQRRALADPLADPLTRPAPARPAPAGAIQRRGGTMPVEGTLTGISGRGTTLLSPTHTYEDVLDLVAGYHGAALTDYDHHLEIVEDLQAKVDAWELKYGSAGLPAAFNVFNQEKSTSKRRRAVKQVKDAIPGERATVRQQAAIKANGEHLADRQTLALYLNEAAGSGDRRLRNSAEWILTGRVPLYAVTPTGDSRVRVRAAGRPRTDFAFFPRGVGGSPGDLMNAITSYNDTDYTDNASVIFDGGDVKGWNQTGHAITVVRPVREAKAAIWATLKHEVQHDADQNKGRDAQAGTRAALATAEAALPGSQARTNATARATAEAQLQSYKTEFRAYSYMGGPSGFDARDNSAQDKTVRVDGVDYRVSTRQLAILNQIKGGYDHTRDGWANNLTLGDGRTFRQAVVAYWEPDTEGLNAFNSVRVDTFVKKLDALGAKDARTLREAQLGLDLRPVTTPYALGGDGPVPVALRELMTAIDALTAEDAQYVLGSDAMQAKIAKHLDPTVREFALGLIRLAQSPTDFQDLLDRLAQMNR